MPRAGGSHLLLRCLLCLLIHPVELVQGLLESCPDLTDHLLCLWKQGVSCSLALPASAPGPASAQRQPFPSSVPGSPQQNRQDLGEGEEVTGGGGGIAGLNQVELNPFGGVRLGRDPAIYRLLPSIILLGI